MRDEAAEKIKETLNGLRRSKMPVLAAIDGRCTAGKSTLAAYLRDELGCGVVHMDDFFLRPEQRTEERLRQPGGNVDWERFREEVLFPLKQGAPFSYRPYNCHTQELGEPVPVTPQEIVLVEGSYSCHPELWDFYDLHIFLTVSYEEQLRRIRRRNGTDGLEVFKSRWIPLEEMYFQTYSIEKRCDLSFDMEGA